MEDKKIRKEIEELFLKPIVISINDMNRFEIKEMKKIRPGKNTWYHWLIHYIPYPIRKSVGSFKHKIASIFKTNTPKKTVHGRGKKLSKLQKQNIKKPFTSDENKEKIKYKIFRDTRALFVTEEEKVGKK